MNPFPEPPEECDCPRCQTAGRLISIINGLRDEEDKLFLAHFMHEKFFLEDKLGEIFSEAVQFEESKPLRFPRKGEGRKGR